MTANNAAKPMQSGPDRTRLDELFHDARAGPFGRRAGPFRRV